MSYRSYFRREAPSSEGDAAAIARLDKLSIFLDSAFRVPLFGTRVGADAILNFVPGVGIVVAKSLSAWIIWEAHRLGVPRAVLARMLTNLAIDFGISIVPVAGWVGDAFFRANLRNVALLKRHLRERSSSFAQPRREKMQRRSSPIIIDGEWTRRPA